MTELPIDTRHRIEREYYEHGVEALSDADLVALLMDRYRPEPPPGPCPVCGDERTIGASGPGPTTWACSPLEPDPDNPNMLRYKRGRGAYAARSKSDAEHYEKSVAYQYRHGDSLVIAALERFVP